MRLRILKHLQNLKTLAKVRLQKCAANKAPTNTLYTSHIAERKKQYDM